MNREGSAVSRRFVANPPFWGSKVASVTGPAWQKNAARTYLLMVVGIFAFSAVLGGVYLGLQGYAARESGGSRAVAEITDVVVRYGFLAVLFAGVGGWYWWSQRSGRRQILLDVTSDSLTVSKRPGDVYPLRDAKLGVWGISGGMTMGTTLHMHCGPRRFVLGGTIALPPGHGSKRPTPDTACRSTWMPGWGPKTSDRFSASPVAAVTSSGGAHTRPHRRDRPGACFFPARCWPSRWGHGPSGDDNSSCNRSTSLAWPSTWAQTRSGWSTRTAMRSSPRRRSRR